MTGQPCRATTPIDLGTPCGAPSTMKVTARCAHGHDREGFACDQHVQQMRQGRTYCYVCFIAAHGCRVFLASFQAVTADVS